MISEIIGVLGTVVVSKDVLIFGDFVEIGTNVAPVAVMAPEVVVVSETDVVSEYTGLPVTVMASEAVVAFWDVVVSGTTMVPETATLREVVVVSGVVSEDTVVP